jgi:acetyl-CoA carboxylase alpha subunit
VAGRKRAVPRLRLKITAPDLVELGLVDEIVKEPTGGAHLDYDLAAELVDEAIGRHLSALAALDPAARLDARYEKFRLMGRLGQSFVDEGGTPPDDGRKRRPRSPQAD